MLRSLIKRMFDLMYLKRSNNVLVSGLPSNTNKALSLKCFPCDIFSLDGLIRLVFKPDINTLVKTSLTGLLLPLHIPTKKYFYKIEDKISLYI